MTSDGNAKLVLWLGFVVVPVKSDILSVVPSTFSSNKNSSTPSSVSVPAVSFIRFDPSSWSILSRPVCVPPNLKSVQELTLELNESDWGCCKTPCSFSSIISPAPVPPSSVIALLAENAEKAKLFKVFNLGPAYAKPFFTL